MHLPEAVIELVESLPADTSALLITRSTPLEGRTFWKGKGEIWRGCASDSEVLTKKDALTTDDP